MVIHSMNRLLVLVLTAVSVFALVGCGDLQPNAMDVEQNRDSSRVSGVCPPFQLRDEAGNVIDPTKGVNDTVPYSPKQTCGASGCHDYGKITEGYHFTQGRGEDPTPDQKRRVGWATTPGNYGGTWCSPAPLYRYLSPKTNETARTMDMTSFSFLSAGCGSCHPGGGSAELDRDGKRYDHRMATPASGLVEGGENGLDGDYYQARWNESGVLEADCLLCHMPGYDMATRNAQIAQENYRWAATAGAGFASVTGTAKDGQRPEVRYDTAHFDAEGRLKARIVREPRNEACLACHAKPGWKKRGANFRPRTDVHLQAGIKCVDCHQAGSQATDPRIRGKEIHQFAKGDDPGGRVRDDLDNTVRECNDCHTSGAMGAPIAEHAWLPPLHLDELACQTCHIPERAVKAALVQAGDVFNPGARIPSKGKHLWTFYGPDGSYWNHYGDLVMMGYDDKPTDPFRPVYARYGGKIFPVNRVHSAWPGIEIEGQTALMQPKMGDVYRMWSAHHSDAKKYPRLAEIKDDNGDGVIEVNRPNEIDALIASVSNMLEQTGYPMDGKRVVWVADARVYSSGTEYRTVETEPWEASPYANVHKYTHDVYPARSALGAGGCLDCHGTGSQIFQGAVLETVFGSNDARSSWIPNHKLLGVSSFFVRLGQLREAWLKPLVYGLGVAVLLLLAGLGLRRLLVTRFHMDARKAASASVILSLVGVTGVLILTASPDLFSYLLVRRFTIDANHAWISFACMALAAATALLPTNASGWRRRTLHLLGMANWAGLIICTVSGLLMFAKLEVLATLTRIAYTGLEFGLVVALLSAITSAVLRLTVPEMQQKSAGNRSGGSEKRRLSGICRRNKVQ